MLLRAPAITGEQWVVVCRPGAVRVNGDLVAVGVRVLCDRDEIVAAPGERIYFSTETLPQIAPFLGSPETTSCPRCLKPVVKGEPSVKCQCGLVYHQDETNGRPCYTYAACVSCSRATTLDGNYRWTPEDFE
jgi:hypothetical protein